jgi:hypothetical protein
MKWNCYQRQIITDKDLREMTKSKINPWLLVVDASYCS